MQLLITLGALALLAVSVNAADLSPGHPPIDTHFAPQALAPLSQKAKVKDLINVPGYTYLEVEQNQQARWIAAPTTAVKKDDLVQFDSGMLMQDFYSKTLKRNFPQIAFVNRVIVSR